MSKKPVTVLLAVALLCLAGCFEVEQEYTLNPDGSGKVVHRVKRADVMGQGEAGLKQLLRQQLDGAEGVDAWSDVEVRMTDDGSHEFVGTAWFSDLNDLVLKDADALQFAWTSNPDGSGRLELATAEPAESSSAEPQDIASQVEEARREWNQMKPMMQGLLGSLAWRASFNLPTRITENASFEAPAPQKATFEIKGQQYFDVLDSLVNDDAFLEEQARSGSLGGMDGGSGAMPAELMANLFGEEGVYLETAPGGSPQFDYASAMAEAKANSESMMAELTTEPAEPAIPAAQGGDFESLAVYETSFRTNEEFSWSEDATLSIAGTLPGSVIAVDEGELRVAVADDGTDLLPDSPSPVRASLDSQDPTKVTFEVVTELPPAGANGFREVSGVLYYQNATEPDEQVVLFDKIEAGASGNAHDAVIESIEPGYMEGTQRIEIMIGLPPEGFSEILFFDSAGNPLDVSWGGTSWTDTTSTLSFNYEGTLPADGEIVAMVRRGMKRYEIPFKVTNIDFLGRSTD